MGGRRNSPKTRLAQARERMYRELILECAERVFAERGYERATMHEVASEAGISLRTLYAVFRGKRDLYEELLRSRSRAFVEAVGEALGGDDGLLHKLRRGVRAYVDFLLTHRDYFTIQLREGRSWGLGPSGQTRDDWALGIAMVSEFLREGMRQGIFADGDPALTAATVIAVMQVQLAGLLARDPHADPGAVASTIAVQLERLLGVAGAEGNRAPRAQATP